MKKFYFALVAMLVSFCASAADYYLIGGFNGWSLKQANCKFTDQGDGTYVLDYNGTLTSGFKINDGTWSNDAANFGGGGQLTIGETYNLVVGGSSGNISMAGNIDNPHIVLNPTAKTLLITGQEVEAQYSYGLWGSFTSSTWGAGDMTEKDGKWVIENLEVTFASAAFGIKKMDAASGSQVDWISAAGVSTITEAGTYDCMVEGTNWSIATGTCSLRFDPEAMTRTVTGEGSGDDPIVVESYFGLHGNIFGGGDWQTVMFTLNADGVYELTSEVVAGDFGIRVMPNAEGTGEQLDWIGGAANITEEDVAYPFVAGNNSASTLEGAYTIYYDATAKTIKFVPYGGEIEVVTTYAIRGNFVDGEWNDYAMTEENGKWTVELVVIPGDFGVKMMENGVQKAWYASPTAEEATISAIGEFQAGDLGTTNWSNTLEGEYKFTFDPETMVLKVDTGSGVEAVEAAEAVEAVYYNLQGVRVANPANGLYIRVAGQKASKVYVK